MRGWSERDGLLFFLMIRRPPRSTQSSSSAASDVYKRQEYEDAKNEQAFVEGRIATLEKMLRNARLIEGPDGDHDEVAVGSRVVLKDLDLGDVEEYTIVGSAEANPSKQRISNESPVGRAVLGKAVGSIVEVLVPAGTVKYQVLQIAR